MYLECTNNSSVKRAFSQLQILTTLAKVLRLSTAVQAAGTAALTATSCLAHVAVARVQYCKAFTKPLYVAAPTSTLCLAPMAAVRVQCCKAFSRLWEFGPLPPTGLPHRRSSSGRAPMRPLSQSHCGIRARMLTSQRSLEASLLLSGALGRAAVGLSETPSRSTLWPVCCSNCIKVIMPMCCSACTPLC